MLIALEADDISVTTLIQESRKGPPATQQSICRVLGVLDYAVNSDVLLQAIDFLVSSVDRSVYLFPSYFGSYSSFFQAPTMLKNIEARRNAYASMPQILSSIIPTLQQRTYLQYPSLGPNSPQTQIYLAELLNEC